MAYDSNQKIGELLIKYQYITEDQLDKAIARQKEVDKRLGDILVEMGYLVEKDLIQVLEFHLGIPNVDLENYVFGPHLMQYIPEHLARRYNVIPLEEDGKYLRVAMNDPTNLVAIDDIEMISGLKVDPLLALSKDIQQAINQVYSLGEDETNDIIDSLEEYHEEEETEEEQHNIIDDAPIVRLANLIIGQAIQMRASDIHIEPQENDVRVRYRIDGVLRDHMHTPKYSQAALISRLKIIADLDITKRQIPQDGRIAMIFNNLKVDMRVSTLPTIYGEKVVIRLLSRDESLINLNKLGFTEDNFQRFKGLIDQPYGIILATGPTGSGKSTTLFAALNYLNSPEKNIVTIEDPIEYQISGINQVQANYQTGLTFARTLRSFLRQDPDIIMVGEIRDEETARIAVRAALTGHLVLSTLHTNDAVSSITRLIDMGIPPYLVASTVIGVIAQRLVRRLCDNCKKEFLPGEKEKEFLELAKSDIIFRAEGCNRCGATGYIGRLAIHEVLVVNDLIREMIVQDASEQEIKEYAVKEGMKTLLNDGIIKIKNGITSYDELIRITV